ncbi:MAG: hypothetical protein WCJ18_09600, partial [Planctomycetota bacterium]
PIFPVERIMELAEVERLLEFARLRVAAAAVGIDSLTRHPGMVVIGHHDRPALLALKQSGRPGAKSLRIVDEKTVVLPVDLGTAGSPEKLLAALRTLLRRQTGRAYSPRPSKAAAHEPSGPAPS